MTIERASSWWEEDPKFSNKQPPPPLCLADFSPLNQNGHPIGTAPCNYTDWSEDSGLVWTLIGTNPGLGGSDFTGVFLNARTQRCATYVAINRAPGIYSWQLNSDNCTWIPTGLNQMQTFYWTNYTTAGIIINNWEKANNEQYPPYLTNGPLVEPNDLPVGDTLDLTVQDPQLVQFSQDDQVPSEKWVALTNTTDNNYQILYDPPPPKITNGAYVAVVTEIVVVISGVTQVISEPATETVPVLTAWNNPFAFPYPPDFAAAAGPYAVTSDLIKAGNNYDQEALPEYDPIEVDSGRTDWTQAGNPSAACYPGANGFTCLGEVAGDPHLTPIAVETGDANLHLTAPIGYQIITGYMPVVTTLTAAT